MKNIKLLLTIGFLTTFFKTIRKKIQKSRKSKSEAKLLIKQQNNL
jgi:hypothetical protein